MRVVPSTLLVLLLTVPSLPVHAEGSPGIVVNEVHPRPHDDGREFIELWNTGTNAVDLTGWNLTDDINTYTFQDWSIAAGGYIVVWGGGNESALGPVWKANVWNNGGDTVRLVAPGGSTVDVMQYGTQDVPAPEVGASLHRDGQWVQDAPTPGQDRNASGGSASATVQDVAPEVEWTTAPMSTRPGQNVTAVFRITEANGDAVQWSLTVADQEIANGTTTGTHNATATAPTKSGDWTWTIQVTSTNHEVLATHNIAVSTGPFRVILPEEGIGFPDLAPGDENVAATSAFTLINQGDGDAGPLLDMSPFEGVGGNLPVDGNLHLIINSTHESTTITYDGPLQPLPSMAPGEEAQITLVLKQVPPVLPAGIYQTSFTVVA